MDLPLIQLLHIFCGQNCEKARSIVSTALFLKGKKPMRKFCASVHHHRVQDMAARKIYILSTVLPVFHTQTVEKNVRNARRTYLSI